MRLPSAETVTKVWVLGGFVVTVLYDLWPALTPARGDTISELFNRKVTPNPFLMLAAGILLAHLLIPAGDGLADRVLAARSAVKVLLGTIAAIWNFFNAFKTWNVDVLLSRTAVIAGIAVSIVTIMYVSEGYKLRKARRRMAEAEANGLLERIDRGFGEARDDE